jgi:hypothetical protein
VKLPSETIDRLEKPHASRTVRVHAGQLLEIPFRGAGWVYSGETALKRGIEFDSRKQDPEGMLFVFKPREAGEYTLKFSKHDFYNDYQIDDTVSVIVAPPETAAGEANRVRAEPRWPPAEWAPPEIRSPKSAAVPAPPPDTRITPETPASAPVVPAAFHPVEAPPENGAAPAKEEAPAAPPFDGEQALADAEAAYKAGNIPRAVENLETLNAAGIPPDDRILYLRGKTYEAPGALRNIKNSINAYTALTSGFPQSPYYDEAVKRIAYLNKFYFNIR